MQPAAIVEHLDEIEDRGPRFLSCGEALLMQPFALQRREVTFSHGVVKARAGPAHAYRNLVTSQHTSVGLAGVLAAAVAVMDQSGWWSSTRYRHLQGPKRQVLSQPRADRPNNDERTSR